jgi:hypothetical protein
MEEAVEEAIGQAMLLLAGKITGDIKSEDALRYSQAALNLAHVLQVKATVADIKK